jgi:hypothetical protein
MTLSECFGRLFRPAAAAVLAAGIAVFSGGAQARDRFSVSLGFTDYGASAIGFGYSTGGHWGRRDWSHRDWSHRGWGYRGWGYRGWGGDHLSLGFTFVVPPASYRPRYYDPPFAWSAAPYYGVPARPIYGYPGFAPAGGVVVFSSPVRERLDWRARGAYYGAYRSALAAPLGEPIDWRVSGDVTTTRDGWAGRRYCREFRQSIVIDGRTEEAYGTACRNAADTDWEIIPD